MKKVLVINTSAMGYNGITSVIMNYATLTNDKVRYSFLPAGNIASAVKSELEEMGEVIIPLYKRSRQPIRYMLWLKELIKKEGFDVVHVHGNSGTMFFDIHAAKMAKVPVRIAHSHSTSCKSMTVHKLLKPVLNRELTNAIACSEAAGKWLFTNKYTVLPNGINIDDFRYSADDRTEYRKKLGMENKFVIGHVGYMDTEKNHMYLLDVFKEFKSLSEISLEEYFMELVK